MNGCEKGYVTVSGTMEVNWTVELPKKLCRKGVACKDPAVEVAMEAVLQQMGVALWGLEEPSAHVYCEVSDLDVTVEEDERDV